MKRWERYLAAGRQALARGVALDAAAFERDLLDWERAWIRGHEPYPVQPIGDAVAISRRLQEDYGQPYAPAREANHG